MRLSKNPFRSIECWIIPAACCALIPTSVQSQEQDQEPTLVRGAFTLLSSLGIEIRDDDNVFQSATDKQSSRISILTPNIRMRVEPAKSRFEVAYEGEHAWYEESNSDNYNDNSLETGAYLRLGRRGGLDFIASHNDEHENRGTELTEGFDFLSGEFDDEPDRYTSDGFVTRFTFGAPDIPPIFRLEASAEDRNYLNNLDRTLQFNRETTYSDATFATRVRPNTSVVFNIRGTDITYDRLRGIGESADSEEFRYLFGVQWEATGKTTGTVRVGHLTKEFDDPSRPNLSAPNWEVAVRWSPRTYSHVDFSTDRRATESTNLSGNAIDTTTSSVGWTHEWNDQLETRISASNLDQDFLDETEGRTQDLRQYSVGLAYKIRPWIMLQGALNQISRNSNIERFVFEGKIVRIGARLQF